MAVGDGPSERPQRDGKPRPRLEHAPLGGEAGVLHLALVRAVRTGEARRRPVRGERDSCLVAERQKLERAGAVEHEREGKGLRCREGPEAEGRIRRDEQRTESRHACTACFEDGRAVAACEHDRLAHRTSVRDGQRDRRLLPMNREIVIFAGEHHGCETTRDAEARRVDGDLVNPASQFSAFHVAGDLELLGQHVELVVDRDGVTVDQSRVGERHDDDRAADRLRLPPRLPDAVTGRGVEM